MDRNELINNIPWPNQVTEMHVHLGGSVPVFRLWEIAVERGIRGMGDGYYEFLESVSIDEKSTKSLDSYLEVYDKVEFIQSGPEAIRESIIIAIHRAVLTGGLPTTAPGGLPTGVKPLFSIGRLELRFNPMKRTGAVFLKGRHAGLYDVDRVIQSACQAVEEVEMAFKGSLQVGLLFCFGRDMTFEANMILAEKINCWSKKTKKIIGIDLAGPESINPLSSSRKLNEMKLTFDTVNSAIPRTIHAGETPHVDLNTFLKTVKALNPNRIAHPIVAIRSYWEDKDDRGLKLIQERDLLCELCVQSNLCTKAVRSLEEYKKIINTLDEFNIKYTFSTDAPSLQNTSLAEELLLLLEHGAATETQILNALKHANKYSFLT